VQFLTNYSRDYYRDYLRDYSRRKREPPAADSPPAEEPFYLEGETPTRASEPRTAEQHRAGVQHALETFEQNGGRPGVADPTQGDPWADKPLKAFCVLVGQDVDYLKPSKRKDWPRSLKEWGNSFSSEKATSATPHETFQCIQGITQSELDWMTFTSPRQTTFQDTMDIMLSRLRSGQPWNATGKKANGGSSTPRKEPVVSSDAVVM
jgi:hypothetical protein